jgi:hypothetical protein
MRVLSLLALSAVLAFGQHTISGSGTIAGDSTSNLATWPTLSAGSSGSFFVSDGTSLRLVGSNGVPIETRKWDGKITTKQHVDATAKLITAKELAPPGYIELAKSLGMKAPTEDEAELLKLIYQHGWKVYDFDKVDDYLCRQAASMKANTRWVWKPMRDKDEKAFAAVGGVEWRETVGMGYVYGQVYDKRVPMAILETAKCVMEDMESAVFLVSDFAVVKPDPFLAVSTPGLLQAGKIFIVARWDEPGFQEEPVTPGPLARK